MVGIVEVWAAIVATSVSTGEAILAGVGILVVLGVVWLLFRVLVVWLLFRVLFSQLPPRRRE